ncbi:hypothetical protein GE061_007015 [Apolygus lucorum]|uniref:Uncharacterized protein n=1 Tax=Apolygus lucorum TaxID=248454 RepID=A0A8S9WQG8_APOLU|nr:hypothetical protein GE061_007015 [Apolygus lucorum]
MVLQALFLIALATLGLAAKNNDVSALLDDFLAFITPVWKARGETGIDFTDISHVEDFPVNDGIKKLLKQSDDPKLRKYSQEKTVPFKFSCTNGKLGDISTLKRVKKSKATEQKVFGVWRSNILTISAVLTLDTMYIRYPNCDIAIGEFYHQNVSITFSISNDAFSTVFLLTGLGRNCATVDPLSVFVHGTPKINTVVRGSPHNKAIEHIFNGLIKEHSLQVSLVANWGLTKAILGATNNPHACGFLRKRINKIKNH